MYNMDSAKPSPRVRAVPAVTRAVAILRLLARSRAPLPLKAIADQLGLVPSTALHILRVLVAEGLVHVEAPTKRYRLGVDVLTLARAVLAYSDVPNMVQPKLDELSQRHSVTAIATEVPNLDHMVVVALASAPGPVRVHVDIGSRFPALVTATGRCVAAYSDYPWEEIERRFKLLRWDNAPTLETWKKEVEATRRNGFNIDRKNYLAGLTLVAAPILNAEGLITHTIACVGLTSQMNKDAAFALAHEMKTAAESVSAKIAEQH
jgi:DNA-binding IclR family transcriptional regulator